MKKHLLVLLLSALSTSVYAGDYASQPSSGQLYGGVSAGTVTSWGRDSGCGEVSLDCVNWKAFAGYKFNSTIGFEAAYYQLAYDDTGLATNDISAVGISAVGFTPINDKAEVFAKVGMAPRKQVIHYDNGVSTNPSNETDVLLGAGGSYRLGENWGVRAEYEYFRGNSKQESVGLLSGGMTYSTY